MWVLGLVHAFSEGSDAGQLWFIALIAITVAPAAGMLAIRHAGSGRSSCDRVPRTAAVAQPGVATP